MSMSPHLRRALASSGSASIMLSSTSGWRSWKEATARGTSVAPALWKLARRSRPPRSPAMAASSSSASSSRERIASACWTSARPASVSRTPRGLRSTSLAPVSRSSAATCCEIADCVKDNASAAAEKEPRVATSRRTFIRRTSSIRGAYRSYRTSSFELMSTACDPGGGGGLSHNARAGGVDTVDGPSRLDPIRPPLRRLGRLLPLHQDRPRRPVAGDDRLHTDVAGGARVAAGGGQARRARRPAPADRPDLPARSGPGGGSLPADHVRRGAHLLVAHGHPRGLRADLDRAARHLGRPGRAIPRLEPRRRGARYGGRRPAARGGRRRRHRRARGRHDGRPREPRLRARGLLPEAALRRPRPSGRRRRNDGCHRAPHRAFRPRHRAGLPPGRRRGERGGCPRHLRHGARVLDLLLPDRQRGAGQGDAGGLRRAGLRGHLRRDAARRALQHRHGGRARPDRGRLLARRGGAPAPSLWPYARRDTGPSRSPVIRLYRAPFSTNVERVALALAHKGLEVESVVIDYAHREPVIRAS